MEKKLLKKIGMIVFIYSLLVFFGGVMGYAMKKSMPSLVAGSFFGLSLLFAGVKTMTFSRYGLYASFGLMLVLDTFFSYRFVTTKVFFPAGAMLLVTTSTLLLALFHLRRLKSVPS